MGIGHVRYPTVGAADSQPFYVCMYVNNPHGIVFAHNGNLTNVPELAKMLHDIERRHLKTTSDSKLLLNFFACGTHTPKGYPLHGGDPPCIVKGKGKGKGYIPGKI